MRGIAFYFWMVAIICVTIGMVWGIQMSASHDHRFSGAHAHLNLVGWVTMGMFGLYYHNVPAAAESCLAKVHFGLATAGVAAMVPGIVMAINQQGSGLVVAGSFLTLASMILFGFIVVTRRS